MGKFYVTTPIYYINDVPHIGHAYTTILADVLARWHRLKGDEVFFLTGLDENSAKTVEAAREQGIEDIQAYADAMAEKWQQVWRKLNISHDDFIRTTQERHKRNVYEFFGRVHGCGDVYKGEYGGFYCEGCEGYLTEQDLVEGKCPLHKTEPKVLKEENYFFRLSDYQERILKHIEASPEFIQPEGRRNEVISFIRQGVRDISISRPGLEWGIKLPIDEKHTIWVWFDALINYMLPLEYWPADVHLIAKDILRFHCVIWPGMLLSAGHELPKRVLVHGFLTVNGQKISKSLGNVVDPVYLAENYSADALRYFLVREISIGQDGDFSEESLRARLNSELADVFGNFVHRTLTFIYSRYGGKVPSGKVDAKLEANVAKRVEEIWGLLEGLQLTQALDRLFAVAKIGNEYFQSSEPWATIKEDPQRAADCLLNCVNLVKILCVALYPFMPSTCERLARQLGLKISSWEQAKGFDIGAGHTISEPSILFRKVQSPSSPQPSQRGKGGRVTAEEFGKLDIQVGNVVGAERVPGSEKLLKLQVELAGERRTVVAGIAKDYTPEELIGKQVAVVVNLEPAKVMGIISKGMVLAAEDEGKLSLIVPDKPVKPGSKVK